MPPEQEVVLEEPVVLDQAALLVRERVQRPQPTIAPLGVARQHRDAERLGSDRLGLTIPFVLYGIFRYLYLVHQKAGGGSPSELLLADRPLLLCVALWGVTSAVIIYRPLLGI